MNAISELDERDLSNLRIIVITDMKRVNGMATDLRMPKFSRQIYSDKVILLYKLYLKLGGSLSIDEIIKVSII